MTATNTATKTATGAFQALEALNVAICDEAKGMTAAGSACGVGATVHDYLRVKNEVIRRHPGATFYR